MEKILDKVYDSLEAPGPIAKWGALTVGCYIGLSVVAVAFRKLHWN